MSGVRSVDYRQFNVGMLGFFVFMLQKMAVAFHDKNRSLITSCKFDGTQFSSNYIGEELVLSFKPLKNKKGLTFLLRFRRGTEFEVYPITLECNRWIENNRVAITHTLKNFGMVVASGPRPIRVGHEEAMEGFVEALAMVEAHTDYAFALHDAGDREHIANNFNEHAISRAAAVARCWNNEDSSGAVINMWT